MRRGGRRRAIPPTLDELRRFAFGGVGFAYDGRSWSPVTHDVDLDALADAHDDREARS